MFWRAVIILVVGYVLHYFWLGQSKITPELLAKHSVRQLSYWKDWQEEKLSDRLRMAPTQILDYLRKDNIMNRWPNRPKAVGLSPEIRRDIVEAIETIPDEIRRQISRKTTGIFVVTDLGGSAYTESVFGEDGQPAYAFVVLDTTVLDRRANEWATWKENTPFRKSSNYALTARIAEVDDDTRVSALRYILLHEFGHVLNTGHSLTEFVDVSWKKKEKEEEFQIAKRELFPEIKKIRYYSEDDDQASAALIEKAYNFLEQTALPTLYATNEPRDDFAESFVNYVHTMLMNKPFEIKIFEEGAEVKTYNHCWDQPRCAKKREILEKFLAPGEGA